MQDNDGYELLTGDKISRLRQEVDRMKTGDTRPGSEDLLSAVKELNENIKKLFHLFADVQEDLLKDYNTGNSPEKKLDEVIKQNKQIAQGIVTLAEKLESQEQQPAKQEQAEQPKPVFFPQRTPMDISPQQPQFSQPQEPQFAQPQFQPMNQSQEEMGDVPPPPMPEQSYAPNISRSRPMPDPYNQQQFGGPQRQMQRPVQSNYPSYDQFEDLGMQSRMGQPLNAEPEKPKKRKLLGF